MAVPWEGTSEKWGGRRSKEGQQLKGREMGSIAGWQEQSLRYRPSTFERKHGIEVGIHRMAFQNKYQAKQQEWSIPSSTCSAGKGHSRSPSHPPFPPPLDPIRHRLTGPMLCAPSLTRGLKRLQDESPTAMMTVEREKHEAVSVLGH